jgi:hypothetical protein
MPRPDGYYWVKFAGDPQPQVVLIQEDGTVWVFGESHGQYIAGEEPDFAKGRGLSLEIIAGPLVAPDIPTLDKPVINPLGRP